MALQELLAGLGYLGETFDKPGRAARGLLAGRPEELLNLVPFSDTMGWTDPSQSVTGRSLLEQLGVLGTNQEGLDFGDVLGFGAELATDPTNFIGGSYLSKLLGRASAAKASNATRQAMLAQGAMPAEIAKLTKAVDEAGKPLRLYTGTGAAFDAYDPARFDKNALFGPGVYLTADPTIASEYAATRAADVAERQMSLGRHLSGAQNKLAHIEGGGTLEYLGYPSESPESLRQQISDWEAALAAAPEPSPNVRMHYLDTRSPFSIDGRLATDQAETILQTVGGPPTRPGATKYLFPDETPPGEYVYSMLDEILSGDKARINNALWSQGYDAIAHTGGNRIGTREHQVYVALDPDRLYSPYVAPALQQEPYVSPLATALAGYNVAARQPYGR